MAETYEGEEKKAANINGQRHGLALKNGALGLPGTAWHQKQGTKFFKGRLRLSTC